MGTLTKDEPRARVLDDAERDATRPHASGRNRGRILVVDDDADAASLLVESLTTRGFNAHAVESAEEALPLLRGRNRYDVVLTDLRMRGKTGIELAAQLQEAGSQIPVVLLTAFGSIPAAIEATRRGAYDFLTKPYDPDVVVLTLGRAVEHARSLSDLRRVRSTSETADGIYTASDAMGSVLTTIARVAPTDVTVLITGESGTGKELVARAIHRRSPRADEPFVALNCAALPETLLESELFGHTRGAFTNARETRPGLIAEAHRGTLFLDEIGDMPLTMQSKLLRVLQEGTVRPVGGDREHPVDVRLLAATNRNLEADVRAGRFREDLFFRVHVVEIGLPPLRARGDDVLLLAQLFLAHAAERAGKPAPAITPAVARRLRAHDWPGNVRELRNVVEGAFALCAGAELHDADLPARLRTSDPASPLTAVAIDELGETPVAQIVSMEEIERRYIEFAMRAFHGNRKLTAEALGLDRSTLYRKLRRYSSKV
jgi:two-component system response regulator HydG